MRLNEEEYADTVFEVGTSLNFTAQHTGELVCFANDAEGLYWNNKDNLTVVVECDGLCKPISDCDANPSCTNHHSDYTDGMPESGDVSTEACFPYAYNYTVSVRVGRRKLEEEEENSDSFSADSAAGRQRRGLGMGSNVNPNTLQRQLSQTRSAYARASSSSSSVSGSGLESESTARYSLPQLYGAQRRLLSWVEGRTAHTLPRVRKPRQHAMNRRGRRTLLSTDADADSSNSTNGTNSTEFDVEAPTHQLQTVYGTLNVCCDNLYSPALVNDSSVWPPKVDEVALLAGNESCHYLNHTYTPVRKS